MGFAKPFGYRSFDILMHNIVFRQIVLEKSIVPPTLHTPDVIANSYKSILF